MEYAQIASSVAQIERGDIDGVYADLMAHERDAIGIAERVSDDLRRSALASASLWHSPLSKLAADYVDFVRSTYALVMADKGELAARRILSPDGLISAGITLLLLAALLTLLRL